MISRTQRILGLDIGSSTVKGVELAKSGDRFTITGYAQSEIASTGTLKDAIVAVLREGRFKSKQVVSSVSGRSVIVRYINTPVMKPEELKESMRFEADKYIPFEMNEVILDTVPLEEKAEADGDMRVVLVAVKRDIIDEHVRLLQEVGLYPCIIDVDCFALGNAFEMAGSAGPAALTIAEEIADQAAEEDATEDETAVDAAAEDEEVTEAEPEGDEEAPVEDDMADEGLAEDFMEPDADEEPQHDTVEMDVEDLAIPEDDLVGEGEEEEDGPKLASAIPDLEEGAEDSDGQRAEGPAPASEVAELPSSGVYALVDIGAQKTNINIMNGETSCFTREVYIGGEDMTEAIAKHLGISPVEAETVKREGDQEASVLEAVGQTIDDLANEIFLSFDYFENQFETEISNVYVSGGGSRLKGIGAVLSETLGRKVMAWNPAAGMEVALAEPHAVKLMENAPQLAVAIGLASRLRKV